MPGKIMTGPVIAALGVSMTGFFMTGVFMTVFGICLLKAYAPSPPSPPGKGEFLFDRNEVTTL